MQTIRSRAPHNAASPTANSSAARAGLDPSNTDYNRLHQSSADAVVTTKEIAGALFVSVKAVESNLSRVYAKLGIRCRVELASRLPKRGAT